MGSLSTSSLATELAPPPPKSPFLSLPPEIRNNVYELLVIKEDPIRVCSPRYAPSSFSVLLRLNKQINTEASTLFYCKNRFILGNGPWGSTSLANAHGLKAFLKRVPKKYLAHITDVVVEIHCRQNYYKWTPVHFSTVHELGSMNDATNLHAVSRALGTHFKGLECVTYRKTNGGAPLYSTAGNPVTRILSDEEVIKQLEKTLQLVLENANVKEIRTFYDTWVDMETAVENILSKKPNAAEILKVPQPPNLSIYLT